MLGRNASLAWVRISRLSRGCNRFHMRYESDGVISQLIRLDVLGRKKLCSPPQSRRLGTRLQGVSGGLPTDTLNAHGGPLGRAIPLSIL